MINRVLIRIKVVQMLYSYQLSKGTKTLSLARKELQQSFDKSYELYNALLQLMIDLTALQDRQLDDAKHKFLPSDEDLHPNMRFVDNALIKNLRANETLKDFVDDNNITWFDDPLFLHLMLDKVLNSEDYKNYMATPETDLATDCEVWYQIMKKVIIPDEDLLDHLEAKSVYLTNDDLEIMGQFALKTIHRVADGVADPISPKYKDEVDGQFGDQLFTDTVNEADENNQLIDKFLKTESWDTDRVALMDRIVMCTALTEIKNFPSIPVNVTLNEYIEIAKNYSTRQSGRFVNGILNSIVRDLRQRRVIVKN